LVRPAACLGIAASLTLALGELAAQQPFGVQRHEVVQADPDPCAKAATGLDGRIDPRLRDRDSVTYRLAPESCLQVKTGKAGLFSFAGHSHVIQARAFSGQVVYYPKDPSRSHLAITVVADSLEVRSPPDTAEIRKVTQAMHEDVLHTAQHHEIELVSRQITPAGHGFRIVAALTLVGQTREVPIDVAIRLEGDTLRAASTFSVKQTDFGIKPYSGGPAGTVKVADRVAFDIHAVAVRSAD
jgi:polyisoprenoid-binding protein YceI